MGKFIDMTGREFGRLTVVGRNDYGKKGPRWDCICVCGATKNVAGDDLKKGSIKSCGCLAIEVWATSKRTHGKTNTPVYRTWIDMIRRCDDPSRNNYQNYGGRGIKVCDQWRVFENFLSDMGDRPDGCSLDRIDNDGNYCPENCRWATREQQQSNTRSNHHVIFDGETVTLAEASRLSGISYVTLKNRVRKKWSNDRLFSPVQTNKQHFRGVQNAIKAEQRKAAIVRNVRAKRKTKVTE